MCLREDAEEVAACKGRTDALRTEHPPLKKAPARASAFSGAGSRGRTDTVSLPLDFESSTSANSIIPAYNIGYYITSLNENQAFLEKFFGLGCFFLCFVIQ